MYSFFRLPVFLLAFIIAVFGVSGLGFAEANPARVISRIDALKSSFPLKAHSIALGVRAEAAAPANHYDFTILRNMQMKFATVLFTPEARADEGTVAPPAEKSDLDKILEAFGAAKGAGAMGIALVIVQLLMLIAKAVWKPTAGWQLTLVLAFTVIANVLTQMVIAKMDLGGALMSTGVLAAIQVLANQIFKKSTEPAKLV